MSYINTAAGNDTVALLLKKVDELQAHAAAMKASHAALVAKFNTQATKLNADDGITDTDYAADAADGSGAVPSTAQSELA